MCHISRQCDTDCNTDIDNEGTLQKVDNGILTMIVMFILRVCYSGGQCDADPSTGVLNDDVTAVNNVIPVQQP